MIPILSASVVRRACLVALAGGAAALLLAARPSAAPPASAPPAEAPPAAVPAPSSAPPSGGPRNIRDFAPEEDAGTADPNTSLRVLFEGLGPDATEWYQHVQTLSNPYFGGRAPGTPGMERAAEYVEWWMGQIGLQPAFPEERLADAEPAKPGAPRVERAPDGAAAVASGTTGAAMVAGPASLDGARPEWTSHRQYFQLPGGAPELESAEVTVAGKPLVIGEEFAVLATSASAKVSAPITFVGYGIKEGKDGYTSFEESTSLDGRIALLLRYEPLDIEGKSRWSDRRFSEHAAIGPKLRELARRGAEGVILVNPPEAVHGRSGLESLETSRWGEGFGIPMVQLSQDAAERLMAALDIEERTLMEWRQMADQGTVKCVPLADVPVSISVTLREKRIRTCNIGGVLPGSGALADEWLIIGAHYDHVGMGLFGTSPAFRGQLHPGADDNASGTGALLVLARRLAKEYADASPEAPRRSILFLAFTAEESGLHGSRYFTQNPTVPGDRTTAMLNMDMVGRLRQDRLSVSGTGTAEGFAEILAPHFANSPLTIEANPSGRGPSDHANFYAAGIPVLFPFTGLHDQYHKPTDKAYTVNPAGAVRIIDLMEDISLDLATRPDRLVFAKSESGGGQDRGYGPVRLGVTPGMGAEETAGVLVEAVAEGSSAAEAGIQPGDLLVAWNGEEMTGARSLMENLQQHKPGDVVQIVLMRNGERQVVTATLKESRRRPQQ